MPPPRPPPSIITVFHRQPSLLHRLAGRASLFQAYTSVFASGYLVYHDAALAAASHLPRPQTALVAALVVSWGVATYQGMKRINEKTVEHIKFDPASNAVEIDTISATGKSSADPKFYVNLSDLYCPKPSTKELTILRNRRDPRQSFHVHRLTGETLDEDFFREIERRRS